MAIFFVDEVQYDHDLKERVCHLWASASDDLDALAVFCQQHFVTVSLDNRWRPAGDGHPEYVECPEALRTALLAGHPRFQFHCIAVSDQDAKTMGVKFPKRKTPPKVVLPLSDIKGDVKPAEETESLESLIGATVVAVEKGKPDYEWRLSQTVPTLVFSNGLRVRMEIEYDDDRGENVIAVSPFRKMNERKCERCGTSRPLAELAMRREIVCGHNGEIMRGHDGNAREGRGVVTCRDLTKCKPKETGNGVIP